MHRTNLEVDFGQSAVVTRYFNIGAALIFKKKKSLLHAKKKKKESEFVNRLNRPPPDMRANSKTEGEGLQPCGTETNRTSIYCVIYLSVAGFTINSFFIAFYKKK